MDVECLNEELSGASQGGKVIEVEKFGEVGQVIEVEQVGYGGAGTSLSTKQFYNDYMNVDGKFVCNIAECRCKKSFKATKTFKHHARDFVCKTLRILQ